MSNALIQALGWALLHSVWQIGLLGLFTLGLERLLRPHPAQLRHNLLLLMLGSMVLASALTLWGEWRYFASIQQFADTGNTPQTTAGVAFNDLEFREQSPNQTPVSLFLRSKMWLETHLSFLVWCWALGIAVFSLRLVWNYLALARLRRNSMPLQDVELDQLLQKVATAIGLRRPVSLRLSTQVQSPLTFGFFVPIVLLPLALVAQTPPALLEALLRHELIHIRRADFLINLGLAFLQILFFYHPLIWVITRRVQELREEACDAEVLASGCNNLLYAEALLQLQKLNHHQNIPLVMQAQNQSSHFAMRLRQIMLRPNPVNNRKYSLALSGSILLLMLLLVVALGAFTTPIRAKKIEPRPILNPTKEAPKKATRAEMTNTNEVNSPILAIENQAEETTSSEASSALIEPISVDSIPTVNGGDAVLSVAAERMNVLYMGIDNPISVALSGISSDKVRVSSNDVILRAVGKGKYIAKAEQLGRASIIVEAPNFRQTVEFRVKPIPDPVAFLDNPRIVNNGEISVSTYRTFKSLNTTLLEFELNAQCEITEFKFICQKANGSNNDLIVILNQGTMFNRRILDIVENVNKGDQIIFANIMVKCPGDDKARPIAGVTNKIVEDKR
ncbi:M56 family metallopeptidase [Haliscomenobacter hydrossis]|uniref:Peptidase M56 BlaR1 n=1 Tax=Haliscomenobacter hydrossis (strain ATCC 27775 / DSM 1100 / LMG 10767 / O) TaxID=760192 RepID=F4KU06_HALH1|nr:M56 family metallopeptidase [Haliscomenobacter hydrossis]AEE49142.1 peptidase M56 BlaR1 [Haliscomenobacter hydrossis DSM 1100]